jgi:hypothetical protein
VAFSNQFLIEEEQILDPVNNIYILEEGKIGLTYKKRGSKINGMVFDSL